MRHIADGYQWGIWKTDETLDELLGMFPQNEKYMEGLQHFASGQRRLEWLAVRVLLYTLLGEEKEVAYYESGKPFLLHSSLSLSISHTKGYVAVILGSHSQEVGIDIEQYGMRVKKVAHKFMHKDEQANLYRGSDVWALLLHWSAKETMFKCMNTSSVDFSEHLYVQPFQPEENGMFYAWEYKTEEKRRFLIHYLLHSDFVLTWFADMFSK